MRPRQPGAPTAPGPGDPSAARALETTAAPQAKAGNADAHATSPTAPRAPSATTVEIPSDCPKTTSVFYGQKPKFGSGTKPSIGSNTTTSAPRESDKSLTMWIIDEQVNGIASVHVGPSTKRVEIDRSCQPITAR